ncbi:hypothetical protein DER45DRAFT_649934 [Fusarium avenaceum]|nr:hypothetical protein DER45DRAFT_649934 [Fusarium avenaceum]
MAKTSSAAVARNSGTSSNDQNAAVAEAIPSSQAPASSSQRDTPEPNTAAAETSDNPNRRWAVESILSHTLHNETFTVDLEIKWTDGDTTTEPEASMQRDVPNLVLKYWEELGGRDQATGFDEWHVFEIHDHHYINKHREYLVQWVGFPADDCTWEPAEKLADIAPGIKARYDRRRRLRN